MFKYSKENFTRLGKDFKTLGSNCLNVLKVVVKIPVEFVKDVKDSRQKSKCEVVSDAECSEN